ncbi:Galactose/lactose metabolism regulatory protein GAL80 [Pseudocercospora fuligena]|uniref:Galactose/lactose metabolism regulatory protein GAL80 n=1 Tax=Pseudocercospora fuligena TaxID=685502 RepID=A0A8H6VH89_9PEZI|nr:Galactose/lactose metabolism regulatory protein GAL80 [Pseudocercospora fuligena]
MAPIRICMIGLSARAKTSWAAEGHLPYLHSERGRAKYSIIALCNFSVEAAQAAVKHFDLPETTKTYGDPHDVANDPEIDLVVVNTRVDVHHVAAPSLRAGKDVWIEWPLAPNVKQAAELADMGKSSGSRMVIGLQGRYAPIVQKLQEMIVVGVVGQVVSSDVRALRSVFPPNGIPASLEYFTDIRVGGNLITVVFGHVIDFIHATLGEFKNFSSRAQIQRPKVRLLSEKGCYIVDSDVPDVVFVNGELEPSSSVAHGATLSVNFRMEPAPFPGEPAFVWTIYGETGDIRVISPDGPFLHTDSYGSPITIEVFDHATGGVVRHEWGWPDWQLQFPPRARNTAELYEQFAMGTNGTCPDFDYAVKRHAEIDKVLEPFLKWYN